LDELDDDLLAFCDRLEPTGEMNPEPTFLAQRVRVVQPRSVGRQGSHLKLSLSQGRSFFDAIGFRLAHRLPRLGDWVDVVFHYELNEFRGVENKQLRLVDIQPAGYFRPGPD
jgi:single-stranded-DNA-specific exonuclease